MRVQLHNGVALFRLAALNATSSMVQAGGITLDNINWQWIESNKDEDLMLPLLLNY